MIGRPMVSIDQTLVRKIIEELFRDGGNHRQAVFDDINRRFLEYARDFFGNVARRKLLGEDINAPDWYLDALRDPTLDKNSIAILGGVPLKTVGNIYGSQRRQVVIEAGETNYIRLREILEELLARDDPQIMVTIKLGAVGVDLTIGESMIVVNSLAGRRAQRSGGVWSSSGNAVEEKLMLTLCELFEVPENCRGKPASKSYHHQIDFTLKSDEREWLVEVKLTGKGNPENVKAVHAHKVKLLVVDRLSERAKETLLEDEIKWVALSEDGGYLQFGDALAAFGIPHTPPADLSRLDDILDRVLPLP